jgi:trigger factor
MKKIIFAVSLLLVATSLLCSCSLTDIFGQAGITSPNSDGASTTENPAYETRPVGEKLTFDGITLSEHILLNFKGIELEVAKLPTEITDKVVMGQLNAMLDYYNSKEDYKYNLVTDRITEEWDYVLFDYAGKIDGEVMERGSDTDFCMLLNEENSPFIPGFATGIIGNMAGTKFDINVTFPENYGDPKIAGKEAVF